MAAAYRVRIHDRQRLFCAQNRRTARRGRYGLRLSHRKGRAAGRNRREDYLSHARDKRRGGRVHRRYRHGPGAHARGTNGRWRAPPDAHGGYRRGASARGKGKPRCIFQRRGDGAGRKRGIPRVYRLSSPRQRRRRKRRCGGDGGEPSRGRLRRAGERGIDPRVAGRGVLRRACGGGICAGCRLSPDRKAGRGNGGVRRGRDRGRILRHRLPACGRMDARPARGGRRGAGAQRVASR